MAVITILNPSTRGLLPTPPPRTKLHPHPNPPPACRAQPNYRPKRSITSPAAPQAHHHDVAARSPSLMGGCVKLSKRGEQKAPAVKEEKVEDEKVELRSRVALDHPELDLYAGTGFLISSPPPSSVPLPLFLKKTSVTKVEVEAEIEGTKDEEQCQ